MTTSRRSLCIGVGSFARAGGKDGEEPDLDALEDLDYAAKYTRELHLALQKAGYSGELITDPASLDAESLGKRVREHLSGPGVAVVHVLSHGQCTAQGGVYVVGSDSRYLPDTRVEQWRLAVADGSDTPTTLFLLDLCHAGAAVHWQPPEPGERQKAWVIAAARAGQPAYAGRLTRAATEVINEITSGRVDLADSVRWVGFDVLFERIRRKMRELASKEGGYSQDPICTPVMGAQPELRFLANPRAGSRLAPDTPVEPEVEPFLDPVLDDRHFRERAEGQAPEVGQVSAGCFIGRKRQLRQLAEWMDGHGKTNIMVVTGSPGVGKSALLGLLVCAAHPALRESTVGLWRHAAASPSRNPDLAAVHARQRGLDEIVASLGRQLLSTGERPRTVEELVNALRRRKTAPVIVLDALDEAIDYQRLIKDLLFKLVDDPPEDNRPACRLLVGTRPWEEMKPLLERAKKHGGLVDLDEIPRRERREDVADYVGKLLELLPGIDTAQCREGRCAFADAVATTLTRAVPAIPGEQGMRWGEFLVAALYTRVVGLDFADEFIDPEKAAKRGREVPRTLPEVLERDLGARSESRWPRRILTVLAYARGLGMPSALLASAATALVDDEELSVEQVAAELAKLRFYLRTSADTDATALYRLFHQGLADHLRASVEPRSGSPIHEHERIFNGLLAAVPMRDGKRRWDLAEPYLRRHAIDHAVDAKRVDELLTDPGFLIYADAATLRPVLESAYNPKSEPARVAATVYRASADKHQSLPPERRRDILAVDATRYGHDKLRDDLLDAPGSKPPSWRPRWATDGQLTIAHHIEWRAEDVLPLACARLRGRPVVVTGGWDSIVRLWDLRSGTLVRVFPTDHAHGVWAVACTRLAGQPVVVTGGGDGMARVWELRTGKPIRSFPDLATRIRAVTCARLGGRPIAVVGRRDGMARVWDLETGRPIGRPLTDFTGPIQAVACTRVDGRPVVVTGGWDQLVRVWDLASGELLVPPFAGHKGRVHAVVCARVKGQPVVVSASRDGTARIWDLTSGELLGAPLTGHEGSVNTLACLNIGGRPVAITGGQDQTVRIWDLQTRQENERIGIPAPVGVLSVSGTNTIVLSFGSDIAVLERVRSLDE